MKKIFTLMLLGLALTTQAQQDPIYALYLNNPFIINPAYAGNNNMFNAQVQYRTQWAGLDANPRTFNVNAHVSLRDNRMGVGLQALQDKIGDIENTEVNLAYAYKLQLENMTLSFGMQGGMMRYATTTHGLNIQDAGDAAFQPLSKTKFNIGAGLILKGDRFMLGLSAPRMLAEKVTAETQTFQTYNQHYYLFGSYLFFLSDNIRLKPSALVRTTANAPASIDVSAIATFNELYNVGLFTRNAKSYGVILQAMVNQFRFGYVFELPGSAASSLNFTSHEFSVGVSMGVFSFHDKKLHTF